MNYEEKYKQALERARNLMTNQNPPAFDKHLIEMVFPELKEKENEDEKIRKGLIKAVSRIFEGHKLFDTDVTREEALAWLEKQDEPKNPIVNVPPRELILSIWDLGNEWKELTNGCILPEYGTQLDYIQKHWYESEYYLKATQGNKSTEDVK